MLFEKWLMKHKWATLVTMQPEIGHQNSQHFYPSEPFKKNHITMRHPVPHIVLGNLGTVHSLSTWFKERI